MRELTLPAPLVLLPGLGADGRVFTRQQDAFGSQVVLPEWIEPERNEALHQYARRWGEQIAPQLPETWFLGGVSLGGMLALEMARFIEPKPQAVFLIASARDASAISSGARLLGDLTKGVPAPVLRQLCRLTAVPFVKANGGDDDLIRTFIAMTKDDDPVRLKWAMDTAVDWDGPGADESGLPPVFQIHGRKDWMIRCVPEHCDEVIPDGRHLIHYTHSRTVNRWMFDHIMALTPGVSMDHPAIEDPDRTAARRKALSV